MIRLNCGFVFFGCFLLAACPSNPYAHRFLTSEPANQDVLGEYKLKEIYLDLIEPGLSDRIRDFTQNSSITLHPDGNATLVDFPFFDVVNTFEYKFKGMENLKAVWEIVPAGGMSSNSGSDDYRIVYGIRFTLLDGRELFDQPSLTGDGDADGMIFTLEDGDWGQILGYSKVTGE